MSVKYIEYNLNPYKVSDESKVNIRLDDEQGARIRWHDCSDNVSLLISADSDGIAKISRMMLALEHARLHVQKVISIDNEDN